MSEFEHRVVHGVDKVEEETWDRLVTPDNPFIRHGFLASLEKTGCVGPSTGWHPRIQLLYHRSGKTAGERLARSTSAGESNRQRTSAPEQTGHDPASNDSLAGDNPTGEPLAAALPLYVKNHSAGEFVFDWAWADAAQRAGIDYYPKAVVAVPFTPVTGARCLINPELSNQTKIKRRLIREAIAFTEKKGLSSIHFNFIPVDDIPIFRDLGFIIRKNLQYHWKNQPRVPESPNRSYKDFSEFLSELRSKKRSNIKRERRRLRNQGVELEVKTGDSLGTAELDLLFEFYRDTVQKFFYGRQYLNRVFFHELGSDWTEHLHAVFANRDNDIYAGALNAVSDKRLYGRYWGTTKDIKFTHFEVCFYRSIEWCIESGIQVFEGGSGGDHKFDRGFMPEYTYSAHYIRHPELNRAIERAVDRENKVIENRFKKMRHNSPFKET